MQCPSCDSKKAMKSTVIVHKFKESGLDNVTLTGVKEYRCENCGEAILDLGDVSQLTRAIAEALLRKKEVLSGEEIRYLRTHVGYSGEIFAKMLGLDKTSLSRIENNRSKVSNQVNMAVRYAVAGKLADRNYELHDLMIALENDDLISFKKVNFKASAKGQWQLQN